MLNKIFQSQGITFESETNNYSLSMRRNKRLMSIFKKENNQCYICGSYEKLCVHHIDNNKENNNIENYQVLCNKCHRLKHPNLPDKFFK